MVNHILIDRIKELLNGLTPKEFIEFLLQLKGGHPDIYEKLIIGLDEEVITFIESLEKK